jgi:uncharacterized protein DUF3237
LKLRNLLKVEITLAPPQELGDAPLGRRRIIGITGGRFLGDRLSGRVLPGGADWQVIRADGVANLDARYRHGPKEVIAQLAAGEPLDPQLYYMRTTPLFETGDARYAWLNRMVCVASGARRAAAVELEVFEVT